MTAIRYAYLDAAATAATLLREPAVAASWGAPSALADFGVSGLAGHLAWQVLSVPRVLAEEVPAAEPLTLLDHYARARWVGVGIDDEVNVGIRDAGEDIAGGGAAALADQVDHTVDDLRAVLPAEPADRLVHIPWGPWSLSLDDFMVTRMMEIVVHTDDLAVSVGVATPPVPLPVLEPVVDLLWRLAARRHGPVALLRALSRAERAPATIAAF